MHEAFMSFKVIANKLCVDIRNDDSNNIVFVQRVKLYLVRSNGSKLKVVACDRVLVYMDVWDLHIPYFPKNQIRVDEFGLDKRVVVERGRDSWVLPGSRESQ